MCNISDYFKQQGRLEGIDETTINTIINLMDSFKMTIDQVMNGMKLSDEEQEKYRSLILKMNQNKND